MTLVKPLPLQKSDITFGQEPFYRLFDDALPAGVVGYNDMKVVQRAAGANLSVDVGSGNGYVAFRTPEGGKRRCRNDATSNSGTPGSPNAPDWALTFTSPDGTNPRLDAVVLQVRDSLLDAGGAYDAVFKVVAGVATSGATLDNRNGASSPLPVNSLHLADVLVGAGASTIVNADIRDRRPVAAIGNGLLPQLTALDVVPLRFLPALPVVESASISHASHDTRQVACAVWLPRKITGATRVRWAYTHGGTAITGNYVLALFDASGRKIIDTGTVAFTGSLNTTQNRSEVISATTFEPGLYWLFLGIDSTAGGAAVGGVSPVVASGGRPIPYTGLARGVTSGGVTVPTTILALTDLANGSTHDYPGVSWAALSVG